MRDFFLELIVGLALMGVGFGVLWLFVGERALDFSGTTAWGIGGALIGGGAVAFLATREVLQKRRAAAEAERMLRERVRAARAARDLSQRSR